MSEARVGFEMRRIQLPLEVVLPVRMFKNPHNLRRYQVIVSSMREVGMVEPLIVHPQKDKSRTYLLLDGHLRYLALKQLGETTAECIIANDDECFTYNARINRLPPIQAHKMIVKAVHNGVRPERFAGWVILNFQWLRSRFAGWLVLNSHPVGSRFAGWVILKSLAPDICAPSPGPLAVPALFAAWTSPADTAQLLIVAGSL